MDYGVLARSYSTLLYLNQLKGVLSSFYNRTSEFDKLSKYQLHKLINDSLLNYYEGEEVVKFKLAQLFRGKDYVSAFEVNVKNSRADFLAINGDSKCFEVKSKIDNLQRLEKQSIDYKDVFEYNTIVIDKKHLDAVYKLVPDYYGIWYFDGYQKIEFRAAKLSASINSNSQISALNKKERLIHFGLIECDAITSQFDSCFINQKFKVALKSRYMLRWEFVNSHWDEILPIDLQFFFNTNIDPNLIYRS